MNLQLIRPLLSGFAQHGSIHSPKGKLQMRRWLVKTDPETFSINDLQKKGISDWDGVRNALAQQYLRQMEEGQEVLIYHSGKEKAVVGLAKLEREKYLDATDPKGKAVCVDLAYVETFAKPIPLADIKATSKLKNFDLVRISRLSVMPVSGAHWKLLMQMAGKSVE